MFSLVVRGDDAASSRSANRALAQCATDGAIRNVSLMACGPHLADAVAQLGALDGVDFGFHVALNCEWESGRFGPVAPVERVPSLVDETDICCAARASCTSAARVSMR